METFHKGADLECGSAGPVLLWVPRTRDAAKLGLEEPQQRPRAVGQCWNSTAKWIFPAAFQKNKNKPKPYPNKC